MGRKHNFDGIRNQLSRAEGIFHALMVHGQAVADADGVELKGDSACVADTGLHGLANLPQMAVTRDIIAGGVDNRHKRPLHLILTDTQGSQKGTVGRSGVSFLQ